MKKQILNILPYIASGFLLLASGCTDEQSGIPVASGTPPVSYTHLTLPTTSRV